MSIILDADINEVTEAAETPSRTYRVDFDSGRILGMADGIEAVEQAIKLALLTPRFECLIYTDRYGSEVQAAMGSSEADDDYLSTVLPFMIEDALLADSRILEVSDIEIELVDDSAPVSFTVSTIFGDTAINITL